MPRIPLEDNFTDVIGKAQRGWRLSDADLATQAGITPEELAAVKGGEIRDHVLRALAKPLKLERNALLELARREWYPEQPLFKRGFSMFNTPHEDMTVNCYLVWDPKTKEGAAFDTGTDISAMMALAKERGVSIKLILLTHTHPDHIAVLGRLKKETGAPAYVCALEPVSGAENFTTGKSFQLGSLKIETRQTAGHSVGGITYVISGLERPVAVVGDALFAGSMGGGIVSWSDALANNRKHIFSLPDDTIVCPGHGPLITVREEKRHNHFYPVFKN